MEYDKRQRGAKGVAGGVPYRQDTVLDGFVYRQFEDIDIQLLTQTERPKLHSQ
jgi:hypothetical protein